MIVDHLCALGVDGQVFFTLPRMNAGEIIARHHAHRVRFEQPKHFANLRIRILRPLLTALPARFHYQWLLSHARSRSTGRE